MVVLRLAQTDAGWLQVSSIAATFLQVAQPVLVLSISLVRLLWKLVLRYGTYMSAGVALQSTEEDNGTELLGAARPKRKTQKQLEEDARPVFRPRRDLLLAPLILASFSYLLDAAILVLYVVLQKGVVDDLDLWTILLPIVAYWIPSFLLITLTGDPLETKSEYYFTLASVSVVCQWLIWLCLVPFSVIYGFHDTVAVTSVTTCSLRTILFTILSAAYLAGWQEEIPQSELSAAILVHSAGEHSVGNGKTDMECDEQEDDQEDAKELDELERHRKARGYDLFSIYKRIRRLLPHIAPVKSGIVRLIVALCVLLSLATSALHVLVPRQTGIVVQHLADGTSPWEAIIVWAILTTTTSSSGLSQAVRRIMWAPIQQYAELEMSAVSFEHVLHLSARYHNNKKTGELLNVLDRATAASDFLDFALFRLAPLLIDLISTTVYMVASYDWQVTILIPLTGLAYASMMLYTNSGLARYETVVNERSDMVSANKNDAVANVELIHYFGAEAYEVDRFKQGTVRTQLAKFQSSAFFKLPDLAENTIANTGSLLGAIVIARQIESGKASVQGWVVFVACMSQLLSALGLIIWLQEYFIKLMVDTDKLMDILEEKSEIIDREDAIELYQCKGEIEFENVTFMYELLHAKRKQAQVAQAGNGEATVDSTFTVANGDTANGNGDASAGDDKKKKKKKGPRIAVQNISFKVKPGQHVAFVGETGAGKSTIFKLLFRFFDVSEGSIKVDGRDIRDYTQHSLRQALGVVQQEGSLFNASILDNIRYGNITATDAEVMEAAKIAKIHNRVVQWPKKYHTIVGERGVKLSGGEKQRVNIARTLLKKPDVLLLDEATSALDTNTEKEIQAQLRELTQGKTTLAIAHRLSTISHSDQIIVLKEGKIQEIGTHEELLAIEDGHYKKLWTAQVTAEKKKEEEKDGDKAKDGKSAEADVTKKDDEVLVDVSVPDEAKTASDNTTSTAVQTEPSVATDITGSAEASTTTQSQQDKDK